MKYVFLGGAGEVGGSSLLIFAGEKTLLIDAGIRVNRQGREALPDLEMLRGLAPRLDAIFISHAHADHIGALPFVHQMSPTTPIYATPPTAYLSYIMLRNAARVMEASGERLFDAETLASTIAQMQKSLWDTETWYPLFDDWKVMFIHSGHILGAVSIVLETPEGRFLYSGDVSGFHQKTIDGIRDLSGINPDFMWCEATYGTGNHPSRTSEEQKLAKAIADVIKKGGSVLIPSFALGRAQEILLILKHSMESNAIPTFPVYVDGLVTAICKGYEKGVHAWKPSIGRRLRTWGENSLKKKGSIFFDKTVQVAPYGTRETLLRDKKPKCIIASSGMLTGGASVEYAKALAPGKNNAIFLSGYQDADSPGRRLQELQHGDTLAFGDGSTVDVTCDVQRFHLSAHSDQGQLINMIKQANPKAIALMHGEPNSIQALREKLAKHYTVLCPKNAQLLDTAETPEATPTRLEPHPEPHLKINVNTDGSIHVNTEDATAERFQHFADGEHVARIKGNRLIITKM